MGSVRGRLIDPWQIGLDHERNEPATKRSARGAWYTPRPVVEELVALAIDAGAPPRSVLDPACGGGAFLLGVLDRLVAIGVAPGEALERVSGTDIDAGAVAAASGAIEAWADLHGTSVPPGRIRLGSALAPQRGPRPDLIIGNPPFGTSLRATDFPAEADAFRSGNSGRLGPYADLAAIHLAAAVDHVASDGRVVMILPQSLLASRDVAGLRSELEPRTHAVWASPEKLFDASVRVWAPIIEGTGDATTRWPELVADMLGAPNVALDGEPFGQRLDVTAGFRDEYYQLVAACRDAEALTDDDLALATVGSLDPLDCAWGREPIRLGKRSWCRPVVSLADLEADPKAHRWVRRQLHPKVLLPTQSKVLEPYVDRSGRTVPVTPVLAVRSLDPGLDLDHVAAAMLAPPLVAWAFRRWFGTALSVNALKLAARQVPELPMPVDRDAWTEAALLVAEADQVSIGDRDDVIAAIGRLMMVAYAVEDPAVFAWWDQRRPRKGRANA